MFELSDSHRRRHHEVLTRRPFLAMLALSTALASGCSGGGASSPAPLRTASPSPYVPAVDAAISLGRLSLGALQAAAEIALLGGANHRSMILNPGTAFAATCDAASASAQSVTLEQNDSVAVVRTALYPPGDTMCAEQPEALAVIGYPATAAYPRVGYGYLENYSLSALTSLSIDSSPPQVSALYVAQQDAATTDVTTLGGVVVPSVPSQPAAGTFPATFPVSFPNESQSLASQVGVLGIAFDANPPFLALVSGGANEKAGWYPFAPIISSQSATGNSYAFSDGGALAFATGANDDATLTESNGAPSYAISRSTQDQARLLSAFPLAAETTTFVVGTKTTIGQVSTAANFATAPVDTISFASDGTVLASHQHDVDGINEVAADLVSTNGSTFTLTITDLIKNVSLITPSPLVLTPNAGVCDFGYTPFAIDGVPIYDDVIDTYGCGSSSAANRRR